MSFKATIVTTVTTALLAATSAGANDIAWLKDVEVRKLPLTMTARQVKASPYLLEPVVDTVTLQITAKAIRWQSQLDPEGFTLNKTTIRTPWQRSLFALMTAIGAGDLAALAGDFELSSQKRGELLAKPAAATKSQRKGQKNSQGMAAVVTNLKLLFTPTAKGKLSLSSLTITGPKESTELSQITTAKIAVPTADRN